MMKELEEANAQFEAHVPYSSAAFLILKAHLVVEVRLLEFIKARISPQLYKKVEEQKEGAFQVRLLLASALAEHDEIPIENNDILWSSLDQLGKLRNQVAHILDHDSTSLEDKMKAFVNKVDPSGKLFGTPIPNAELHRTFRDAASYLNSLFSINRQPLLMADEMLHLP